MFFEIALIAVAIGLLRGGSLANLKKLNFKLVSLMLAAFVIQAGIDFWGSRQPWWGYPYLHIFSYFLLFFALYSNRLIPGIQLIFAGTFLNFIVIAFNNGVMPVTADVLPEKVSAAFAAGLGGTHGLIDGTTRLNFLADILFVPLPYQPQVLSLGDLVIDAGIMVILITAMVRRSSL